MSHAVNPFRPVLRQRSVLRRHKPQQEQRKTRETQRGHAEECLPGLFIHSKLSSGFGHHATSRGTLRVYKSPRVRLEPTNCMRVDG